MRLRSTNRRETGFTLIEILITLTIIAILAAILIGNFLRAQAQSRVAASKGNVRSIALALETYFTEKKDYPDTLATLVPTYTRGIPDDPCINAPYVYAKTEESVSDYRLETASWANSGCRMVASGLYYIPGGGLGVTP